MLSATYLLYDIFEKNSFWKLCASADLLHKSICARCHQSTRSAHSLALSGAHFGRTFSMNSMDHLVERRRQTLKRCIQASLRQLPGTLRVQYFHFPFTFFLLMCVNFVQWNSDSVDAIDTAYLHSLRSRTNVQIKGFDKMNSTTAKLRKKNRKKIPLEIMCIITVSWCGCGSRNGAPYANQVVYMMCLACAQAIYQTAQSTATTL